MQAGSTSKATPVDPATARAALLAAAESSIAERLAADPGLDDVIAEALDRVAAAWPWYCPTSDLFSLAGAGLEDEESDAATLSRRQWADLALLEGFRRAVPEAAEVVNDLLARHAADAALTRGATADQADDLVQERLSRLLLPLDAVKYRGRGRLAAWLRRCVVNDWIDATRRKRMVSLESIDVDAHAAVVLEAEVESVARRFRPHFRVALGAAFDALPDRDRTMLRMIHIDGLTAKQVGAVLGMHRGSVQRRLGLLRDGLRTSVIEHLERRFGIGASEASSVLRAFAGRLDQTLSRLMAGRE